MSAQQVFAVIRARSKYTDQQPRAYGPLLPKKGAAIPFPVTFRKDVGGYCVDGNNNHYRLEDLNLFVLVGSLEKWQRDGVHRDINWPFVSIT